MIQTRFEELRLKMARQTDERRPSLEQIAAATGLAVGTLHRLSTGAGTRVDLNTLDKLCGFFDCSVGDLLEYVPESS